MKKCIFKGVGTAIITPFKDGRIDFKSFALLLNRQVNAGVDAIIVLGTTGEPCTINNKERGEIIKFAINQLKGKCKIIIGCGSNNTKTAINQYKQAELLGADGALIVTPYYNKCTQNGIFEYYKQISESGNLPIIAYNVPSRTGVNIKPQTLEKISSLNNIYGVKEASGDIQQILEIFKKSSNKIAIYSGDDSLNNIFYLLGGDGCISVLSNITPSLVKQVYTNAKKGNIFTTNNYHFDLLNLTNSLFLEVNPIPIKAGLSYLGLCSDEVRPPLTKMEDDNLNILKKDINSLWSKYDSL